MKEIKFRAWIKEQPKEKSWMYKWNINEIDAMLGIERDIMQYTGLKDKNGKEIYEGDIVEVTYSDGSGYDNPVEVNFENGSFWVGMGYLNDVKIIEVIGNIHENPNLLTN